MREEQLRASELLKDKLDELKRRQESELYEKLSFKQRQMDQEIEKLKQHHETQRKTERQRYQEEIAELRNQLNYLTEKLESINAEWEAKMNGSSQSMAQQLQEMKQRHSDEMQSLRDEKQAELEAFRKEMEEKLRRLREDLEH